MIKKVVLSFKIFIMGVRFVRRVLILAFSGLAALCYILIAFRQQKEAQSINFDVKRKVTNESTVSHSVIDLPFRWIKKFIPDLNDDTYWSDYSCCLHGLGVRTREGFYYRVQVQTCDTNYCLFCEDDMKLCQAMKMLRNACNKNSIYINFMIRHCPATCGWCDSYYTVPVLQEVRGYYNSFQVRENGSYVYMYSGSQALGLPWIPLEDCNMHQGDVERFYLAVEPSGDFNVPIYFCQSYWDGCYAGAISRSVCEGQWRTEMVLYSATRESAGSEGVPATVELLVSNLNIPPFASRVYIGDPCCGYYEGTFSIYAASIPYCEDGGPPGTETMTATTLEATTLEVTSAPNESLTTSFTALSTDSLANPTPVPLVGDDSLPDLPIPAPQVADVDIQTRASQTNLNPDNISPEEFECLTSHNRYRRMHWVGELKWSQDLAHSAKGWANFLGRNAPSGTSSLLLSLYSTNFPYSNLIGLLLVSFFKPGGRHRDLTVGENVMYFKKATNQSILTAVTSFYAEIFNYKFAGLTAGPYADQFIQLVWASTTQVGCGYSVQNNPESSPQSEWIVVHYDVKPRQDAQEYVRNVLPLNTPEGSCMSPKFCSTTAGNVTNHCLLFRGNTCGCMNDKAESFNGRPLCVGTDGCVARCKRPRITQSYPKIVLATWREVCEGHTRCECLLSPQNSTSIIGANCS